MFLRCVYACHPLHRGTWCSGITPAQHAGGPGLNPQRVHLYGASSSVALRKRAPPQPGTPPPQAAGQAACDATAPGPMAPLAIRCAGACGDRAYVTAPVAVATLAARCWLLMVCFLPAVCVEVTLAVCLRAASLRHPPREQLQSVPACQQHLPHLCSSSYASMGLHVTHGHVV